MLLATKPHLKFAKSIEDPKHLVNKIEELTEKVCSSSYTHPHPPTSTQVLEAVCAIIEHIQMCGLYRAVN